jgi:hypothetical protein
MQQNNLSQLNFRLKLNTTPELEMRVQTVNIPGLNLGTIDIPTPFVVIPEPGNISYEQLTVTFMVGEEMKDYMEIFDWMVGLGYPDGLGTYRRKFIDGSVLILNSNQKLLKNIRFTNMFPVTLSDLTFDSTLTEVQYATATASFRFERFYYENA